jgi:hypothetical protein
MSGWQRWALRILYWIAVLAVSLVVLVLLILVIESRDQSSVGSQAPPAPRV